jgi:hypothetical protein
MNDLKLRQQTGGGGMSKSKRALTQRLQLAMPTICEVLDPRTPVPNSTTALGGPDQTSLARSRRSRFG